MQKWLWCMTNSAPDCVLINDPKKMFWIKLYVTIPQWSETFPKMSGLSSDCNSAKCGLQLNDPIDWFKLRFRLNQPKTPHNWEICTCLLDWCSLCTFLWALWWRWDALPLRRRVRPFCRHSLSLPCWLLTEQIWKENVCRSRDRLFKISSNCYQLAIQCSGNITERKVTGSSPYVLGFCLTFLSNLVKFRDCSHLATTTWKFYVVRSLFWCQVWIVTLVTRQRIFLSSGMGAAPIPDDMKFDIVVVKCERSHIPKAKLNICVCVYLLIAVTSPAAALNNRLKTLFASLSPFLALGSSLSVVSVRWS